MQLNKKQNSLIEDLKKLKLYGMAGDLENQFINEDVYSKVTFFNRIEQLINKQITYALNKKYNSLLKRSKIKDYFRQYEVTSANVNSWIYRVNCRC